MFYTQFISLCEKNNVKPTPLIKSLGLSPGNLKRWENGSTVNSDILLKLSEHFGVSIDYLLTGNEKSSPTVNLTADEQELLTYYNKLSRLNKGRLLERAELLTETDKNPFKEPKNTIFIEYYDLPVSAGTGIYLDHDDKDMIEVEETPLTSEANFALRVSGDSMEPLYHNGDTILIESQPFVNEGEIGVFIVNGEGYVKKYGGDCLISLNPKYKNIKLSEYDQIYCKGKVIGVL